jgi:hypothetical protein
VEGEGPDGEVPLVADAPITLQIDGEDWRGTAAYDDYQATVGVDGREPAVAEVAATETACPQEGVMASEFAYLAALRQVAVFEGGDEALMLTARGCGCASSQPSRGRRSGRGPGCRPRAPNPPPPPGPRHNPAAPPPRPRARWSNAGGGG